MNEKEARLWALCQAGGYEGVRLRRRSNIAWLADGADVHCDRATDLGVAELIWTPGSRMVVTNVIESARLRDEEFPSGWEIRSRGWWEAPSLVDGRLLWDWPDDPLAEVRATLTPGEVDRARSLGSDTGQTLGEVMRRVMRGETEHSVASRISAALLERGIFPRVMLIAADGRISRYRHPIPTCARINRTVMAAVCAQRQGLVVSATRLVSIGAISDDLRRRHDAVCAVDHTLHEATRVGVSWGDALSRGIREYAAQGFPDEWKLHHQGGPAGFECRDLVATPAEARRVQPRQLVAWNPSITGTKSEDTILSDSREVLTSTPAWPVNARVPGGRPDILVL